MKKKSKLVSFVKKDVSKENLDKLKGGNADWLCSGCRYIGSTFCDSNSGCCFMPKIA